MTDLQKITYLGVALQERRRKMIMLAPSQKKYEEAVAEYEEVREFLNSKLSGELRRIEND